MWALLVWLVLPVGCASPPVDQIELMPAPDVYGDGLLNVARKTSVYVSGHDKALGVSQFLTRRQRIGQLWGGAGDEMLPLVRQALINLNDQIAFINVSEAEASELGNGHGYFLTSPWASSDILMTIYYGLTPEQRGLVLQEDMPVYTFPQDYISRLWAAIEDVDPEFAEELSKLREAESAAGE